MTVSGLRQLDTGDVLSVWVFAHSDVDWETHANSAGFHVALISDGLSMTAGSSDADVVAGGSIWSETVRQLLSQVLLRGFHFCLSPILTTRFRPVRQTGRTRREQRGVQPFWWRWLGSLRDLTGRANPVLRGRVCPPRRHLHVIRDLVSLQ